MNFTDSQFLPNDHSIQVNFEPNPRVLDCRGLWAEKLTQSLKLKHWLIQENRIDVFDQPETWHAYVTFNQCGLTCRDVEDREPFGPRIRHFVKAVFALENFGNPVTVKRIGVLQRFFTQFKNSFEQLRNRVQERYANIHEDALKVIGASVTDVGAPFYFRDELGEFRTLCGPMRREQAKSEIFVYKEANDLPDVGLFYLIDYFEKPDKALSDDEVVEKAQAFATAAWSRHQRIRKLIVG